MYHSDYRIQPLVSRKTNHFVFSVGGPGEISFDEQRSDSRNRTDVPDLQNEFVSSESGWDQPDSAAIPAGRMC